MRPYAPKSTARRWIGLLLATATTAAAVTVPTALTASAATGTPVVGVASGRCLDVKGNTPTLGSSVSIWTCSGQANQTWDLTTRGELRVFAGTRCLDVAQQDRTSPARVQIYTCNGGDNQRWRIGADGSIVGVQSGLCLDVTGKNTVNGALVQLWTCSGQTNQKWRRPDTQPPTVPARARVSGLTCNTVDFAWDA